jgi:hypothetical protein
MDEKPQEQMYLEYKNGNESTVSGAGDDAALALSMEEFTKRERAVLWKLDCFIAPVMMLLMLISYLDRGNVRLFSLLATLTTMFLVN